MKQQNENVPHCTAHATDTSHLERVRADLPSVDVMHELSDFFKILGDSTRLAILSALDLTPLCVCELSELFGMTVSAISHQLKILRQNNLVKYTRIGKNVMYSLADDHVRGIVEYALEHINE